MLVLCLFLSRRYSSPMQVIHRMMPLGFLNRLLCPGPLLPGCWPVGPLHSDKGPRYEGPQGPTVKTCRAVAGLSDILWLSFAFVGWCALAIALLWSPLYV